MCAEVACSPCTWVVFLQALRLPHTVQRHVQLGIRLIGGAALYIGVRVCENVWDSMDYGRAVSMVICQESLNIMLQKCID